MCLRAKICLTSVGTPKICYISMFARSGMSAVCRHIDKQVRFMSTLRPVFDWDCHFAMDCGLSHRLGQTPRGFSFSAMAARLTYLHTQSHQVCGYTLYLKCHNQKTATPRMSMKSFHSSFSCARRIGLCASWFLAQFASIPLFVKTKNTPQKNKMLQLHFI